MKYAKQEKYYPMQNSASILMNKKVAIVGIGGLGSHSAEYMTRMGIGNIVLIDDDFVEGSNLARQGLYYHQDSVQHIQKVERAGEQLIKMNPEVKLTLCPYRLTKDNISKLFEDVDLVLDGTDNLSTRYLINDYCYEQNIPWIYASATASIGTVVNFIPGKTPCFRCVYGNETNEDKASCDINGVILPILTAITSIQVTEAMKLLLDKEPSTEEIRYNIWTREENSIDTAIFLEEDCVCQKKNLPLEIDDALSIRMICGGDTIQILTPFDLSTLTEKIVKNGYRITRKNDVLVEGISDNKKRIVAYKTGKLACYNLSKEEAKKLL